MVKKKAALRLLRKGVTAAQVAEHKEVRVHRTTVQRWAKEAGIELRWPHNRHKEREDLVDAAEIIRLRKRKTEGRPLFTYEEIAALCSCSRSWVSRVLAEARRDGKL
jgi:DNA invertase Pin-like site-specific DNA recombinase